MAPSQKDDLRLLLGCIGVSLITYNILKQIRKWINTQPPTEYVPVGTVKNLYIFPMKSARPKKIFSFFCGERGPEIGEIKDRAFQLVDGNTGNFYTARIKPKIIVVEVDIRDGHFIIILPDKQTVKINLEIIKQRNDVRKTIYKGKHIDAVDCGEEVSKLMSSFLEEENVRLVMMDPNLYNERVIVPSQNWWNNPVPKREDRVNFHDFAPYLIQTEASLDDLNSKLENQIEQVQLRPVIVVDKCAAWDEDLWSDVKIGEAEIQLYRPCNRCTIPTIDPQTGIRSPASEPLKTLRTYRLAPEGPLRKEFKDSPIFGTCGGATKTGYIHEGQTVYARYKKTPF